MLKQIAFLTLAMSSVPIYPVPQPLTTRLLAIWLGTALLVLIPETIFEETPKGRRKRMRSIVSSAILAAGCASLVHAIYGSELISFGTAATVAIFGDQLIRYIMEIEAKNKILERFLTAVAFRFLWLDLRDPEQKDKDKKNGEKSSSKEV